MSRQTRPDEITPDVLLRAYSIGLFPMAESADSNALFWVDPEERGVFPLDGLVISRSLAKAIRADRFEIRVDHDFDAVIEACAAAAPDRPGTWINPRIRRLYRALHERGQVHTIEAYAEGRLVGGLYGVRLGAAFFGESMFHRATDASKVALAHLVARLRTGGFTLLDTQFVTPHLASLGAVAVPKKAYHALLDGAVTQAADFFRWPKTPAVTGRQALAALA